MVIEAYYAAICSEHARGRYPGLHACVVIDYDRLCSGDNVTTALLAEGKYGWPRRPGAC